MTVRAEAVWTVVKHELDRSLEVGAGWLPATVALVRWMTQQGSSGKVLLQNCSIQSVRNISGYVTFHRSVFLSFRATAPTYWVCCLIRRRHVTIWFQQLHNWLIRRSVRCLDSRRIYGYWAFPIERVEISRIAQSSIIFMCQGAGSLTGKGIAILLAG